MYDNNKGDQHLFVCMRKLCYGQSVATPYKHLNYVTSFIIEVFVIKVFVSELGLE